MLHATCQVCFYIHELLICVTMPKDDSTDVGQGHVSKVIVQA